MTTTSTPAQRAAAAKAKAKAKAAAAAKKKAAAKAAAAARKAVFDQIETNFGLTDSILDLDKTDPKTGFTLKEAFDQIRARQITDSNLAANILAKTNWFKQYGTAITQRLAQERTSPGVFKGFVDSEFSTLKQQVIQNGLEIDDASLRAIAREQYAYGLSGAQTMDRLRGKAKAGANSNPEQQLRALAGQMGVKYSDQWYRDAALQVGTVGANQNSYEDMIKEAAKDTYGYWADKIDAGQTVEALAGQYLQSAQSYLENPNVGLDDLAVKKALQTVGADGRPMPLWEFEKSIKSDPRWKTTKNAQTAYANVASQLLNSWGKG